MMDTVPQIVPVSDMSQKQTHVLAKLANGPVVLAQRSKPTAVLVYIEEWHALINRLEIAEALNAHLDAKRRFEQNPPKMYSLAEIEAMVRENS
ncbi:MAG: type II toxin-antitoxin system Phd/YefM family antitoxin [Caldilineaceae bacterium]